MTLDPTPVLQRDTFVINQKAKLFELRNQFAVFDETGQPLGTVEQVNRSAFAVFARVVSDLDVMLPMTLEFRDTAGQPLLTMHKPWFRWGCVVSRPDGAVMGRVTKEIRLGKARFALHGPAGERLGSVLAQNWRAKDFSIRDGDDVEVARITKKWAGMAREIFTDADNYVVTLQPGLPDPLRSLAIGTALAVDTVMKNKDSGGGLAVDLFNG